MIAFSVSPHGSTGGMHLPDHLDELADRAQSSELFSAPRLEAAPFARSRGAETVALVRSADSPLAAETDHVLAYNSPGLYCLPLLAVTLFAAEWGRLDGNREAEAVAAAAQTLPTRMGAAF